MMVRYDQLDTAASFSTAFNQVGMHWASYLVALGAVLGIVTGVLVRELAASLRCSSVLAAACFACSVVLAAPHVACFTTALTALHCRRWA